MAPEIRSLGKVVAASHTRRQTRRAAVRLQLSTRTILGIIMT